MLEAWQWNTPDMYLFQVLGKLSCVTCTLTYMDKMHTIYFVYSLPIAFHQKKIGIWIQTTIIICTYASLPTSFNVKYVSRTKHKCVRTKNISVPKYDFFTCLLVNIIYEILVYFSNIYKVENFLPNLLMDYTLLCNYWLV